jgi:DNA-binding NtrC family response regulator
MPLGIQAKILRLLQEKSIERLGGQTTIPVDVRIIAATNRNLEVAVAEGRFREDLYYRLKVVTLWLPALRNRSGDIPLLADYFLARFSRETGSQNPGMSEEAKGFLSHQPWPGHVRELANTIHKALIFNRGGPITLEDISRVIGTESVSKQTEDAADEAIRQWVREGLTSGTGKDIFASLTDRFGCIVIGEVLNLTGGNRTRASELLGMSRPTLLSKIEKYRLKTEISIKAD